LTVAPGRGLVVVMEKDAEALSTPVNAVHPTNPSRETITSRSNGVRIRNRSISAFLPSMRFD
jgi:hypothetical protein